MLKSGCWIALATIAVALHAASDMRGALLPQWDWKLQDIAGKTHAPFEDPATRAVVLVFISTDCPIANSYQPQLRRLTEKYASPGIRWFMIHPDPTTTREQAAEHARQFEIIAPVVIDNDYLITRAVGARVMPQVFVFTSANEAVGYEGRIDDLYADYGKKRAAATTRELADALQAIVDEKPVEVRKTEPVGCFISFQEEAGPAVVAYDPLKVAEAEIEQLTLTVDDDDRSRVIPVRVYLPVETAAAPIILFSHGLGGSRDNSPYLGNHWAKRGYVAVFMQHPGSDESVWKGIRLRERMDAMRKAASGENFMLRVKDVPAVIDQLEQWNQQEGHPLKGRLKTELIGMTGHSFGAVTTQAVSGQFFPGGVTFTDPRIKCALPMSPSTNKMTKPERSFGSVDIPWLLMTGTRDSSPINDTGVESRLAVYPALPAGNKYELVLDQAEHSAFGDRALPGERGERNPNHHRAILAISTAFWDTFLKDDPAAREWLDGESVRQVLEPADRWQKK